jgi:acylphosphatase
MAEQRRVHLIIKGIVQGVFFRAYVRQTAIDANVAGWVRNLYDGSVEAVFEGNKNDVEIAMAKCYKGPSASVVEGIDIKWEEFVGEFSFFSIRY